MWYKEAQNSTMTYRWQTTDKGDALYLSTSATKNGFITQPAILILFKIEDGLRADVPFKKENLKQSEISSIFQNVQNELFKYPPGWITERLGNDFQIEIVLDLYKDNKGQVEGYTSYPGGYLVLRKDGIGSSIHHEIAHNLDFKRIAKLPFMNFNFEDKISNFLIQQKDGTYMAPTEYGKTSNSEAFADAYQILAENGIKYRLPDTTKENIDKNRLFDYVEKFITQGNYKTKLTDFGDNLQLRSMEHQNQNFNLYDQRVQTIIGGFQNAIDRFVGDKQKYGLSLIQNKQKIKDIVEYLNNTQSEFFTTPASDKEIKNALDYLKEKIDKKGYDQHKVMDNTRRDETVPSEVLSLEYAPKAVVDIIDWIKKSKGTKKTPGNKYFIDYKGAKASLSTQLTQLLDNYFKNGSKENLILLKDRKSVV